MCFASLSVTCYGARSDVESPLVQQLVGDLRHELEQLLLQGDALEDGASLVGTSGSPHLLPHLVADALSLLIEDLARELDGDAATIIEPRLVADPLPDLRTADLGGGRILHEVVDRSGTPARQPEGDVAEGDAHVGSQPRLGDGAGCRADIQQRPRVDALRRRLPADLIRLRS